MDDDERRPPSSARSRPARRCSSQDASSTGRAPGRAPAPRRHRPDAGLSAALRVRTALLRGRPQHPVGPDGRMALSRPPARAPRPAAALRRWSWSSAFVVALFFYDQLLDLVLDPYNEARAALPDDRRDQGRTSTAPPARCCCSSSCAASPRIVVSSPYWLYQIWAFIVPGLHPRARSAGRGSSPRVAGPLFIAGVAARLLRAAQGPRGADRLHPRRAGRTSSSSASTSRFFTRMLLVFGIAFEIPLFVIMLNLAGVRQRQGAGSLPGLDHHRHLRLRRGGHAVDRPVLDADPGHPDAGALPRRRGGRPARRPRRGRGADGTDQWDDDEVSHPVSPR